MRSSTYTNTPISWEDGGIGEPSAHLIQRIQLVNNVISLNNPWSDWKAGRTNSTTKGREEVKVRRAKTQSESKRDLATCGGEGAGGTKKGRKQIFTPAAHALGEGISLLFAFACEMGYLSWVLKNQQDLKPGIFKIPRFQSGRAPKTLGNGVPALK